MGSSTGKMLCNRKGFTLLELLISMLLILLVTVITVGALRLGYRSVESGDKRISAQERFRNSLNIVDSQIQSGIPIGWTEKEIEKVYFKGEPDSMQFSTNYSIWDGRRGYLIAEYRVEQDSDGKKRLIASENTIGMENKRETLLMSAMDDIRFEYFGTVAAEAARTSRWTETASVPEKIWMHLILRGRDYSMVIPLRAKGLLPQTGLTPGSLSPGTGGPSGK
jgi:prepilin-type N-terminal cleavage/methylation domain-containing protein